MSCGPSNHNEPAPELQIKPRGSETFTLAADRVGIRRVRFDRRLSERARVLMQLRDRQFDR